MTTLDPKKSTHLPFDFAKQQALIGHLFREPLLYTQLRAVDVKSTMFLESPAQVIWGLLERWYKEFKRMPGFEEFRHSQFIEIEISDPSRRGEILAYIIKAEDKSQQFKLDALRRELEVWVKSTYFLEVVGTGLQEYNKGHFDEAFNITQRAVKKITGVSLDTTANYDWKLFDETVERRKDVDSDLLTFGLNTVDRCLLEPTAEKEKIVNDNSKFLMGMRKAVLDAFADYEPERDWAKLYGPSGIFSRARSGMYGSLRRGDTTMLLSPTNIGKSTTLITVAASNLLLGRDVLFLTHEGSQDDLVFKIMRCIVGKTENEILTDYAAGNTALYRKAMALCDRHLVYRHMQHARGTVEAVQAYVEQQQAIWKAKWGKGFDLLVDDYPANLTTREASQGHMAPRERIDTVYGTFVDLAGEHGFHCLAAIQTNRDGSRSNKEQEEDGKLLDVEDVSEAFGPMMRAANVVSLNRPPRGEAENWLIYFVAKTRSTSKGWAVIAESDYSISRTHWVNLPSSYYRGNGLMVERVRGLLKSTTNNGNQLSSEDTNKVQG